MNSTLSTTQPNLLSLSPTYWPELPYERFQPTAHLLHMTAQLIGKLKLATPFEPHWDNVPLWVTSEGLSSGLIPYQQAGFSVAIDMFAHAVVITTTWGQRASFRLTSMSVAQLTAVLLANLQQLGIVVTINPVPQEIPDPIPFDQDRRICEYDPALAQAWWQILLSIHQVMHRYHARFLGRTAPIGFMWGTFDLRDVRYNEQIVLGPQQKLDYIRRNAMDVAQIEVGWWAGSATYPRPAFYAFTFPQPVGIENAEIMPEQARWEPSLGEFILDYEEVRVAKDPAQMLLDFFESTYQVGAELAGWEPRLIGSGKPK